MIFVPQLHKDYSMNSKRFWNKNRNPRTVFGIMVSRSLDVSLHFNENLKISDFLYILWNFRIFVHRLRKDYLMKKCISKRFWNKNGNPRTVFGIRVSRSLDVSLHFNENLIISGFLYIFWKFVKINENRLFELVWTFFSKVFQKLLQFGTGFWSFLDISEHFKKSFHFLIIRNRY